MRFFVAGTMQGSQRGSKTISQGYRQQIEEIINATCTDWEVVCPQKEMFSMLSEKRRNIEESHQKLSTLKNMSSEDYDGNIKLLTSTFHHLVNVAANCDVCVAYLPGHEASMGTAMEIYSAYLNNRYIIVITEMNQNLAILSCANQIISRTDGLGEVLSRFL